MKAVVDTSPLILLAKLGRLPLLPGPCGTTPLVLKELEGDARAPRPEVAAVRRLVEAGQLLVQGAEPLSIGRQFGLAVAEASVLQLALDRKVGRAIVDDKAAMRAAKALGLAVTSTPFLFLEARRSGAITLPEFAGLLDRLVAERYFLSAPLYRSLLDLAAEAP